MCTGGGADKGYALLKYERQEDASHAIEACQNGLTVLEQRLDADYAFVRPPHMAAPVRARRDPRARSPSPMR